MSTLGGPSGPAVRLGRGGAIRGRHALAARVGAQPVRPQRLSGPTCLLSSAPPRPLESSSSSAARPEPAVPQPPAPLPPPAPAAEPQQQQQQQPAPAKRPGPAVAILSSVGAYNMKIKAQNQDAFIVERVEPLDTDHATILGVYDGHGPHGHQVARHVSRQMAAAIQEYARQVLNPPTPDESLLWWDAEFYVVNLSSATALAAEVATPAGLTPDVAQQALGAAFTAAAESMPDAGCDLAKSGATALVCMVLADSIVAAWAGDSRAVVGTLGEGGSCTAHQLSRDHKPNDLAEMARIVSAGGRVVRQADAAGRPMGPFRVLPSSSAGLVTSGLSIARAFGDTMLSPYGVVAEPEFAVFPLSAPPAGSSSSSSSSSVGAGAAGGGPARPAHVLVLGTDGLWDVLSNEEAVALAAAAGGPERAATALVGEAKLRWARKTAGRHRDDITVAVAYL